MENSLENYGHWDESVYSLTAGAKRSSSNSVNCGWNPYHFRIFRNSGIFRICGGVGRRGVFRWESLNLFSRNTTYTTYTDVLLYTYTTTLYTLYTHLYNTLYASILQSIHIYTSLYIHLYYTFYYTIQHIPKLL